VIIKNLALERPLEIPKLIFFDYLFEKMKTKYYICIGLVFVFSLIIEAGVVPRFPLFVYRCISF
jgi:hypothetical protein